VVTISIAPRKAFYPIEKVRIDLSDVGGGAELKLLPDASREGVYNLETKVNPLDPGYKLVTVTAIDRLGWEKSADLTLIVLE
jgi:hypothetical protein